MSTENNTPTNHLPEQEIETEARRIAREKLAQDRAKELVKEWTTKEEREYLSQAKDGVVGFFKSAAQRVAEAKQERRREHARRELAMEKALNSISESEIQAYLDAQHDGDEQVSEA